MYKGVFIELGINLLDSRLMYCIYNGLSETGDVGEETLEWNVPRLADSSLCVCEIGTFEYLNI